MSAAAGNGPASDGGGEVPGGGDHEAVVEMTTYKRADGEMLFDEWSFSTDIESCVADSDGRSEPSEYIEEKWVRVAERCFVLPTCGDLGCDQAATFWGLCETHAREDDPSSFDDDDPRCAMCGWERSHTRHHDPKLYNHHPFKASPSGSRLSSPAGGSVSPEDPEGKNQ